MAVNYSFQAYKQESMARTYGKDLPLSTRQSMEIADSLRGMKVEKALALLEDVINFQRPIQYRTRGSAPHKKGFGPAKYPIKAASFFVKLLEQVQAHAHAKGLSNNLQIIHINAHKAGNTPRYGRKRRIQAKKSHIEVVVTEAPEANDKKRENKKKVKEQ